jgi:hypothetical protein
MAWCVEHVSDEQAIIAIDDPYAPAMEQGAGERWGDALAKVATQVQKGDWDQLPVIVCCGPSEQADRTAPPAGPWPAAC